jgi:oligoendopeptidase F
LRPWDVDFDPSNRSPLKPFKSVDDLESTTATIFHNIDPVLGNYFDTMRQRGLLDLDNRKGKRVGAFCTHFDTTDEPFIMMNAVGVHTDVITLLHESGHAFHVFETAHLPYFQQGDIGMEFVEVPSQAMELLALPFLHIENGGYYNDEDHARATIELLERIITFLPYMAVVDGFQHWVYENSQAALNPANCDQTWAALWDRFMVGVDWSGLDEEKATGWHRKRHIFARPFYYVEYGMAYLGAVQIWKNALSDQAAALKAYRHALALGGTVPLPDLYAAADIKFAFDRDTIATCVDLIESQMDRQMAKL